MILWPCKNYLPIFLSCIVLLSFQSCGFLERSTGYESESGAGNPEEHSKEAKAKRPLYREGQQYLSRYEWAVQSFESGENDLAIVEFQKLKKLGSAVPNYNKIPYFLGMAYFKKNDWKQAKTLLEEYVHQNQADPDSQEAVIALLYVYEKEKNWSALATLAGEADKVNLFQTNRIQQKLLWARALREQHELQGARSSLKEALAYLQNIPTSLSDPYAEDLNQDLWGRYQFTDIDIQAENCGLPEPSDKKEKKKITRLYRQWMEGVVDCFHATLATAEKEIFPTDSKWSETAARSIAVGLGVFATKIRQFQALEAGNITLRQSIDKDARQQFYRLLSAVDANLKQNREQKLPTASLLLLRKSMDALIVSLSSPK